MRLQLHHLHGAGDASDTSTPIWFSSRFFSPDLEPDMGSQRTSDVNIDEFKIRNFKIPIFKNADLSWLFVATLCFFGTPTLKPSRVIRKFTNSKFEISNIWNLQFENFEILKFEIWDFEILNFKFVNIDVTGPLWAHFWLQIRKKHKNLELNQIGVLASDASPAPWRWWSWRRI